MKRILSAILAMLMFFSVFSATSLPAFATENEESAEESALQEPCSDNPIPNGVTQYGEHYYCYYSTSVTWEEAKAACEALGGHLVTITDSAEQAFVNSFNISYCWLGGYLDGDTWKWVTGEEWSYTYWNTGEPNNNGGNECVLGLYSAKWNDYSPNETHGYLCEWETVCSCVANLNAFNGHYYKVFNNKSTWELAKTYCESLNGHLATITSAEENSAVYEIMKNAGYTSAYFGLTDKVTEGTWKWVTGEVYSYANWASGEPNGKTSENYGMYFYQNTDGTWNDGDFGDSSDGGKAFICEWDSKDSYFQYCGLTTTDGTHNYELKQEIPATCTKTGTKVFTCTNCGLTKKTVIPALGHNLEYHRAKTATCIECGWDAYQTCSRCDYTTYAEIPAIGHCWVSQDTETVPPTCTVPGQGNFTCERCSETISGTVSALGHDYINHEAKPATCTENGWKAYQTCSRCEYTSFDETEMLGHDFLYGVCTRCGEEDPDYADPCESYTDIDRNSWYHSAADFVIERGLMGSTRQDVLTFEPNTKTSRAMIVSILYRLEGSPSVSYKATFTDVKSSAWFASGVIWASENEIVSGYGNGKFGPNDNITREQLASILMRYTNFKSYKTNELADLNGFSDGSKVGGWAQLAVKWSVGFGIISGKASGGNTKLDPQGKATRAEVASILMRYIQKQTEMQRLENPNTCSHNWVVSTSKEPTCKDKGNTVYYCLECADKATLVLEALGHADTLTASLTPTCTEAGWNQWTCSRCGRTYKDPQKALGHDDTKTVVSATCTSGGYEQFTCKRCNRSYKQNQTAALGHTMDKYAYCTRCGAYPGVFMFASDGRVSLVSSDKVEAWKAVSWYTIDGFSSLVSSRKITFAACGEAASALDGYIQNYFFEKYHSQAQTTLKKLLAAWKVANNGCPLAVISQKVYSKYGYKNAYIEFRNLSEKTITRFDIVFTCYDAYGNLVYKYGYGSSQFNGYCDSSTVGAYSLAGITWTLYGYDACNIIKNITVKKVAFSDGTTWSK